jgi:hypothetical protein
MQKNVEKYSKNKLFAFNRVEIFKINKNNK